MGLIPDGHDVASFIGRRSKSEDDHAAAIVTAFVRSYVHDNGFPLEPDDELPDALAAVIVTAAARLAENPGQMGRFEANGAVSIVPGTFTGFTVAELAVLHRYRRRTA